MVDFVTPFVNPTTFVTRLEAVFCTPFTIEAAKSDPGSVGIEIVRPPELGAPSFVPAGALPGVDGR